MVICYIIYACLFDYNTVVLLKLILFRPRQKCNKEVFRCTKCNPSDFSK